MSSEDKKALVRRFYEAHVKGDLDALRKMMAPDFADRSLRPDQEESDREAYLRGIAEDRAAFSDIRFTIEDQIAEGDKVVTRYTGRSIQRDEFLGVAPTGNQGLSTGIDIHRIAGDKITEEWSESNNVNILVPAFEEEKHNRERIEQELLVAQRIQQASLPKEVPELEGWEITPYYQPAREVGGDFYDFHLLSEGKLGLVVGDATGKGVPAALVMSTTCGMLRLAAQGSSSPGEMLQRVNEALFPYIPPNMFVTCFYGILDPDSGTFTYANAGHDLPYLCHGGGDAEELRARGMPLGLMPGMRYEEKEIVLHASEAALFYSDGLVEAHDPKGEMFGFPRLRRLVADYGEERSLEEVLLEELYSFVGDGWEQEDDITLLTLQRFRSQS
jgi:serine phosphatase RsbU (regulator of sigma subunit)/ketosteroid isomerase-like protein